MDAMGDY